MQEGYQIIELKNRVSDVLTQVSIKVSDVLKLLGQRCADIHQLKFRFRSKSLKLERPKNFRCVEKYTGKREEKSRDSHMSFNPDFIVI